MEYAKTFLCSLLLASSLGAAAHQDAGHRDKPLSREQKPWGIAGDDRAVKRTVVVTMSDQMRFSPDLVEVRQGETVKFVIRNTGKLLHEMVIGTTRELDEHAALMARFPDMEHDEPYMAHVAAGKSGQMVWTFNRAGEFDFACLIAGHYQAGMKGTLRVLPDTRVSGAAAAPEAYTEAEVRKVDKENGKLTLRHGEIKSLDMPAMTMVFQVTDAAVLEQLKPGDKVRFKAAREGGKYTVTEILPAP